MSDLVKLEDNKVLSLFSSGGLDSILSEIENKVNEFIPDLSSERGRKEIASMAYKVSRSKTIIENLGKKLIEEEKKKIDKVNAERKKSRDFLDSLKEKIRKPLTDFENKEKERVDKIKSRISTIEAFDLVDRYTNSEDVRCSIEELCDLEINGTEFQEYTVQASKIKEKSLSSLRDKFSVLIKQEQEQEELEKLRKEKAEREQKEREERIAKEAAEKAEKEKQQAIKEKEEAEKRAEAEKKQREEQEKQRIENEKKREQEHKEQLEREKKLAAENERKRIEAEKKQREEAEKSRQDDIEHRKKINNKLLASFSSVGISEESGKALISKIVKREINNIKITY